MLDQPLNPQPGLRKRRDNRAQRMRRRRYWPKRHKASRLVDAQGRYSAILGQREQLAPIITANLRGGFATQTKVAQRFI